jgi:prephenate dehydratase
MLRIGYQGETGAFSEEAVRTLFPDARPVPHRGFRSIFEDVESRALEFGVVPVENSQAGSINETYDLLARGSARIVGEVIVRVNHALLALPGTRIEEVKRVSSHPQALAQCQEYLAELDAEVVPVYDTAGAAKRIAEGALVGEAAIASERAAEVYGLEVLASKIQTDPHNQTRFAAISADAKPLGPTDKTSLVFEVRSIPGALYRCLGPLAARGLNLSKLESRPLGGRPWEYRFYLDVEAGAHEAALREALEEIGEFTVNLQVLGSYPRWRE